jgi:hypothetical protein
LARKYDNLFSSLKERGREFVKGEIFAPIILRCHPQKFTLQKDFEISERKKKFY